MTRSFEELNDIFDTQEMRCIEATSKLESARTKIGKFFARRRLERERQELEQIADESDIAEMYLGPAGEPIQPKLPPQSPVSGIANTRIRTTDTSGPHLM